MSRSNLAPPADQAERDRILTDLKRNLLVEAAAGSGKTTCLVGRMVALLAAGECRMAELAAMTFTKKAAAELRSRFHIALQAAADAAQLPAQKGRLQQALAECNLTFIGTIHAFSARLLRERPVEAGVAIPFREVDEAEDSELRREAWERFVTRTYAEGSPLLADLKLRGLLLNDLYDGFHRFADYPDIDQWPGTSNEPPPVKAVAGAFRKLLRHMEETTPCFTKPPGKQDALAGHYFRLPRRARIRQLEHLPELLPLLEECEELAITDVTKTKWPGADTKASVAFVTRELDRWNQFCRQYARPAVTAWRAWRYGAVLATLQAAQREYDRLRAERGVLNFQDLLLRAVRLLRDYPAVRRYFRRRFTHLLVDEFQDTDPLQAELMVLLSAKEDRLTNWRKATPTPGALFVVGDPQQSIYRFRRADIVTYETVKQLLVNTGGSVVALTANFRSTQPLVEWVNQTFSGVFPRQPTPEAPAHQALTVGSAMPSAKPTFFRLEPHAKVARVTQLAMAEASQVAAFIAAELRQQPARCPDDYLVIARDTFRLGLYAQALAAHGLPAVVSGGASVSRHRVLWDLLQWLEALADPTDSIALVALARGRQFGFSDPQLFRFHEAGGVFSWLSTVPASLSSGDQAAWKQLFGQLAAIHGRFQREPALAAIDGLLADTGLVLLDRLTRNDETLPYALAHVRQLLDAEAAAGATLRGLAQRLRSILEEDEKVDSSGGSASGAGVRVMNLHKAKGLEGDTVFLVDPGEEKKRAVELHVDRHGTAVRGYLAIHGKRRHPQVPGPLLAHPVDWDTLQAKESKFIKAEKDRLRYVAVTRAKRRLIIHSPLEGKENFWTPLAAALPRCPTLVAEFQPTPTSPVEMLVSQEDVAAWTRGMQERRTAVLRHSYAQAGVKALAVTGLPGLVAPAAQGAEWGTLLHELLQMLIRHPALVLESVTAMALAERGLPADWLPSVCAVVEGVRGSRLWARALGSDRCLVEVPIHTWKAEPGGQPPLNVLGQIDLVFREPAGWVLVDYKTDRQLKTHMPELVARYRPQVEAYAELWSNATGEPIVEKFLYFTHWQQEVAF